MTGLEIGLAIAFVAVSFWAAYLTDRLRQEQRTIRRLGLPLCKVDQHTDGPWERQTWAGAETCQCQICGRTEWRLMTGLRRVQ